MSLSVHWSFCVLKNNSSGLFIRLFVFKLNLPSLKRFHWLYDTAGPCPTWGVRVRCLNPPKTLLKLIHSLLHNTHSVSVVYGNPTSERCVWRNRFKGVPILSYSQCSKFHTVCCPQWWTLRQTAWESEIFPVCLCLKRLGADAEMMQTKPSITWSFWGSFISR